jgi:heme A synthase
MVRHDLLAVPPQKTHDHAMKQRLHRSITFWSGLLVMGFLVWAWWDSERLSSNAKRDPYWGRSTWGGVFIGNSGENPLGDLSFLSPPPSRSWNFSRAPATEVLRHTPEAFPPPIFFRPEGLPAAESEEVLNRWIDHDVEPLPFTVREQVILTLRYVGNDGSWILFVPHWLILLTVAAVWIALLLWRASRRRKAAAL